MRNKRLDVPANPNGAENWHVQIWSERHKKWLLLGGSTGIRSYALGFMTGYSYAKMKENPRLRLCDREGFAYEEM